MREASGGQTASPDQPSGKWFWWAERRPGVMLMGALMFAVMALQMPPRVADTDYDVSGEEVPLFI